MYKTDISTQKGRKLDRLEQQRQNMANARKHNSKVQKATKRDEWGEISDMVDDYIISERIRTGSTYCDIWDSIPRGLAR